MQWVKKNLEVVIIVLQTCMLYREMTQSRKQSMLRNTAQTWTAFQNVIIKLSQWLRTDYLK